MQAALELSGEEVIPSIHVLRQRQGKWLHCYQKEVILQAPHQIIGVKEQEVLGEIDDLVPTFVSELLSRLHSTASAAGLELTVSAAVDEAGCSPCSADSGGPIYDPVNKRGELGQHPG
jgi:hypothetical protein